MPVGREDVSQGSLLTQLPDGDPGAAIVRIRQVLRMRKPKIS
jgi:hypothetical protein